MKNKDVRRRGNYIFNDIIVMHNCLPNELNESVYIASKYTDSSSMIKSFDLKGCRLTEIRYENSLLWTVLFPKVASILWNRALLYKDLVSESRQDPRAIIRPYPPH